MILVLAEKPSVAKTIAAFLKAGARKNGYFEGLVHGRWKTIHLYRSLSSNSRWIKIRINSLK